MPAANDGQFDLLYAAAYGRSDGDTVQLNFQHALTAIAFRATTQSTSISVTVDSIRLCNVRTRGVFTWPTASTTADDLTSPRGQWQVADDSRSYQYAGISQPVTLSSLDVADLTGTDGQLTLLPQTLVAWDLTAPATAQTGSYLAIRCRLMAGGRYYSGSETGYGYIYVPFGGTFRENQHYVYTLQFGMGYQEDGTENLRVRVSLSATIADWNVEDVNFDQQVI